MRPWRSARPLWLLLACGVLCVGVRGRGTAQGDEVLGHSFDENINGWFSPDPEAKLRRATEAVNVRSGGALEFDYRIRENAISAIARPNVRIAGANSLDFWAKCTHATGLAFGVNEKTTQARYSAMAYLPADTWTHVLINLNELQLGEDSKDDNGQLDLDQVESFYMADVGVFTQMINPEIRGARKLWLDEFKFLRNPAPTAAGLRVDGGAYLVESFEGGLLRWLTIGVTFDPVKFTLFPKVNYDTTTDVPEGGGKWALKVGYPRPRLSAFAVVRDIYGLDVKKTEKITFWIRTDKTATLISTLEKTNSARYNHAFTVTPNLWTKVELAISGYTLADDSKDPDGALDLVRVKQFSILDLNLTMDSAGDNTIYLDDVVFVFAK